jgi:hypothetical protein
MTKADDARPEHIGTTSAYAALELVRLRALSLDGLYREIGALRDAERNVTPWTTRGAGASTSSEHGAHSDPTATEAQARIDGLARQIAATQAKIDDAERIVGEGLRLIASVREAVGDQYASVLEIYYIDGASTWSAIAYELGVHRNTVRLWRDIALAWIDANCALHRIL